MSEPAFVGSSTEAPAKPVRQTTSTEIFGAGVHVHCITCGPRSRIFVMVEGRTAGEIADRLAGHERAHALCSGGVPR